MLCTVSVLLLSLINFVRSSDESGSINQGLPLPSAPPMSLDIYVQLAEKDAEIQQLTQRNHNLGHFNLQLTRQVNTLQDEKQVLQNENQMLRNQLAQSDNQPAQNRPLLPAPVAPPADSSVARRFDPERMDRTIFKTSDNGRTIEKKMNHCQSDHVGITGSFANGEESIELRVEASRSGGLQFGVIPVQDFVLHSEDAQPFEAQPFEARSIRQGDGPYQHRISVGSTIRITVDTRRTTFYVNGEEIRSSWFGAGHGPLMFFITMRYKGDRVKIM